MPTLSRENRKLLENAVVAVRASAVKGALTVLKDQFAVGEPAPWPHMTKPQCALRVQLRAHGRQLGDRRDPQRDTQELDHLAQACAYEHWHRMLFSRFLAENDLLLDPDHGVAMSMGEIREMAEGQHRDWQELAAELAQRMLLAVFRPEDPVLSISLPPETRQQLEQKLDSLPTEIFTADDSLGWVYQFWQRDEKERVNKSGVKIGADELPAVTQLFTEDYMVLFLLENTLGAWWTAKRRAEGKDPALPGYTWTYLRLNDEGSPAAGGFEGWQRTTKELRVLDPCMGSGHFLVFALPILARMRMEEEELQIKDALFAVLRDNLFGLEIDERCAQIAAFNLALAAWHLVGEHFALPELNLACSGVGPNATKEQWIELGEEIAARGGMPATSNLFATENSLLSEPVKRTMESLHELFSQAPVLGSLIDPSRLRLDLFQADYKSVAPLLAAVLKAENASEETREQVIAAAGMVKAADLLSGKYTLVATNVPYLGLRKQSAVLRDFSIREFPAAKEDLATVFCERIWRLLGEATMAVVTPQNWFYQYRYRQFRNSILSTKTIDLIARLGEGGFQAPQAAGAFVALNVISGKTPTGNSSIYLVDASDPSDPESKEKTLRDGVIKNVSQGSQLKNPDARLSMEQPNSLPLLNEFVATAQGIKTGDDFLWVRCFWEIFRVFDGWKFYQTSAETTSYYAARSLLIDWRGGGEGMVRPRVDSPVVGRVGVVTSAMREISITLYTGELHYSLATPLVPHDAEHLLALWAYCSSPEYNRAVREIEQNIAVTTDTLAKVPFDLKYWKQIAREKFPDGLPKPSSSDATQWLFNGHPKGSDSPLQVTVARLVGYQWPRQRGSSFLDCPALGPDGLEPFAAEDGIVPLSPIAGEVSAADRLRALLVDSFGSEWSATKLYELLGKWDSLEAWLRDGFFEEHCRMFQTKQGEARPFIWHVWDGRKDGFHALVNYHKLAAPHGEGRNTLEKLIYTTLGDWITRQRIDVLAGADGADGRLAAAEHLKGQLEKILEGETPYDIFVRWKPLHEQPIGWEPDINDGVRLNIRPWIASTLAPSTRPKKDACILRVTPKIKFGNDRGKEPQREKEDFPWFWTWDETSEDFRGGEKFDGARWNDPHYSLGAKKHARDRKRRSEDA